jgi:hypothetical protein
MFGPDMSILLGAAKILSPEGKSKMWDANADGFARGEGIGVTILKVRYPRICNFGGLKFTKLTCSCSLWTRHCAMAIPSVQLCWLQQPMKMGTPLVYRCLTARRNRI